MARTTFDFNLGTAPTRGARRVDEESSMRILVAGDFSGRRAAGAGDLPGRRPLAVDIDTYDQVLRRIGPKYTTPGGEDLPAHAYVEDGEKRMQACAESHLSERAGQALLQRGLIPLLSYANRNAIRVMRLQSVAEPPRALAGPWD